MGDKNENENEKDETRDAKPEGSLLEQLLEQRKSLIDATAALVEARETERSKFEERDEKEITAEERSAFTAAEDAFGETFDSKRSEIRELDKRIDEAELKERRREEAARASRHDVRVTSEPLTYRRDNERDVSYFADLAAATVPSAASRMEDPAGAVQRLQRHAEEMNRELPKRDQARERRAQAQIDRAEREFTGSVVGMGRRGLGESPFERRVNPNRTDGQGGYFVPPLWLIDEYIPALRAGRVAADLCRNLDLPEGTDSINIPKLSTPTATGVQTADNQPVTSQDFTDTSVSAGVKTIAGQEDVALQLIEQSPGQIVDRVIMEDLLADYNTRVDAQVLTGTNASGQLNGILPATNWSGTNTVTWTTSAPLGPSYNQVLGAMASKTSYNRFDLQNLHLLGHPRRWFWFATALDGANGTSGRPVVNSRDVAYNVSAVEQDPSPAQGKVGHLPFGPDYHIDGNVPLVATAAGAISGGANDLAVAAKWDDLWLFEGNLRTRVLSEVLSGTLQLRFQAYNYVAFLVRYGQSITVAQGTGFAAPTAAGDTSITY
jgi:hypothetical protein